jgi:hypothetical protein
MTCSVGLKKIALCMDGRWLEDRSGGEEIEKRRHPTNGTARNFWKSCQEVASIASTEITSARIAGTRPSVGFVTKEGTPPHSATRN